MSDREEITMNAADELIMQSLKELELSDPELREAEVALSQVYEQALSDPELDEKARKRLAEYISKLTSVTNKQFRHLYKQGGKDLVQFLKEVGVL